MHKSAIGLLVAIAMASPLSSYAYTLDTPVSVQSSYSAGSGEVDTTVASSVTGSFTVSNTNDERVWVTAGDVAHGEPGYGFMAYEDKLYAVSRVDSVIAYFMPLGFIRPGVPIEVKAIYTPGDGIRVDTTTVGLGFAQYSRGILVSLFAPGTIRGAGAFNVSATSATQPVDVFVGSWGYAAK